MKQKKIISSLAYKFTERLLAKGIGLVISIILARLLAPDDFGQLAILAVFINLSQTIIQGGLNTALVQSKNVDDRDYSTVFFISAVVSALLIILLYFSAPFISDYYGSNQLTWPLRAYSVTLLFGAFNSVQVAKLQREMKFKETMYSSLIATILSGVLGITLAYLNFGLWALVIYNSSNIILSCLTMLVATKWFPRLMFSWKRAKDLVSFGWKMLVSAILCSVSQDIRSLIIGKKYSTESLAYYNRGQQIPTIISHTLDSAIQSVMFPVLASHQDRIEQVKAMLKRTITFSAFLIVPIMIMLSVMSKSIVLILLTDKWLPCVYFMQIICLAELTFPLTSSNLIAIKSIGRSDVYMKLEFIRRIVMLFILAVSVFCFNSIKAIVIGYLISYWIDYIIIMVPIKKLFNYGFREQIKDIWKILLASAIMGIIIYLFSWLNINTIAMCCLQIVMAIISYMILCSILKIESYNYFKNKILRFLKKPN